MYQRHQARHQPRHVWRRHQQRSDMGGAWGGQKGRAVQERGVRAADQTRPRRGRGSDKSPSQAQPKARPSLFFPCHRHLSKQTESCPLPARGRVGKCTWRRGHSIAAVVTGASTANHCFSSQTRVSSAQAKTCMRDNLTPQGGGADARMLQLSSPDTGQSSC